jgi:hypothetical protein
VIYIFEALHKLYQFSTRFTVRIKPSLRSLSHLNFSYSLKLKQFSMLRQKTLTRHRFMSISPRAVANKCSSHSSPQIHRALLFCWLRLSIELDQSFLGVLLWDRVFCCCAWLAWQQLWITTNWRDWRSSSRTCKLECTRHVSSFCSASWSTTRRLRRSVRFVHFRSHFFYFFSISWCVCETFTPAYWLEYDTSHFLIDCSLGWMGLNTSTHRSIPIALILPTEKWETTLALERVFKITTRADY